MTSGLNLRGVTMLGFFYGKPWKSNAKLSEVLEPKVSERFCLSPRAAAGIIRRAAKRGRVLPARLEQALQSLAASKPSTEFPMIKATDATRSLPSKTSPRPSKRPKATTDTAARAATDPTICSSTPTKKKSSRKRSARNGPKDPQGPPATSTII